MKKSIWTMALVMSMMLLLVACGGAGTEPAVSNPAPATATSAPTDNSASNSTSANENSEPAAPVSEPAEEVEPVSVDENGLVDASQIVVKGNWHIDEESGFLYAYGSVTNNSDQTITGMIDFMYYDDKGQALLANNLTGESDDQRTSSDDVVFSAPIAHGATGYYNRVRDLTNVNGQITKVETFLKYAIAETGFPTMDFANLKWEKTEDETMVITAQLSNNGNSTCVYPSVAIAFFKGGEVIAVETGIFEPELNSLEIGQTSDVSVTKYMLPADFDDVQVVGDCASTSFPRE